MWDDVVLVTGPRTEPKSKAAGALLGYWSQQAGSLAPGYYLARELSLALDRKLWGESASGFHVTNVALHIVSCLLLYAFGLQVTGRQGLSLAWAAVWAAHPAAAECTDWVKNRSILLCSATSLASLALVCASGTGTRTRRVALGLASAVFLAAALLCKEIAVVVPALAVWVAFVAPRLALRRMRWPLVGLWAVLAVYLGMKAFAFALAPQRDLVRPPRDPRKPALVYRVLKSYTAYASIAASPFNLCADRALNSRYHVLGGLIVAACCIIGWQRGRGRRRWPILLGLGWLAIGLLPASNLLYLSDRPLAEQRMYMALPGIGAILVGLGWRRRVWTLGALLVPLAALTVARHFVWAGNYSLWNSTVRQAPDRARPRLNLGNAYFQRSRYAASERCYRQAIYRDSTWADPWTQTARARVAAGDVAGAVAPFERSLALGANPWVCFALAGCHAEQGQLDKALVLCRTALAMEPGLTDARVRIAMIHTAQGNGEEAEAVLQDAVGRDPKSVWAQYELGNVYLKRGRAVEALERYHAALAAGEGFANLFANMGVALQMLGRGDEARSAFKRSFESSVETWQAWQALGLVADSMGQFVLARTHYLNALKLHPQATIVRRRLKAIEELLSRSGKPSVD